MNNKILFVLLILSQGWLIWLIAGNWQFYSRPYNHELLSKLYSNSQYVIGSGSRGIGDDGLYAFAGYYYITGGDPSQVNFEHPPLGKYLIGLSILIFHNENFIYIIYAFGLLISVYLLASIVYRNQSLALIAVITLSLSQMFRLQFLSTNPAQFGVSLLDMPLTLFFMLGLYFFLLNKAGVINYLLSNLYFGVAFSSKFFPALILLLPALAVYIWFYNRKFLRLWLLSLLIIPLVYLLSYTAFFVYHPAFGDFIKYQKYIISWRMGNPVVAGNIIRAVFTGSYQNWWNGGTVVDQEWSISIPALVVLGLGGGLLALKSKVQTKVRLLLTLSGIFLGYLSFGSVGVVRYLLPVYPVFIIMAVNLLNPLSRIKQLLK